MSNENIYNNDAQDNLVEEGYFDNPRVSQSRLKLLDPLRGGSPARYIQGFLEKNYAARHFDKGKAFHLSLLEPSRIKKVEYFRPSGKPGQIADRLIDRYPQVVFQSGQESVNTLEKAAKEEDYGQKWAFETRQKALKEAKTLEYAKEQILNKANKTIGVTEEEKKSLDKARESVLRNPFMANMMEKETEKEVVVLFKTEGVECKARLDMVLLTPEHVIIVDPKSTERLARDPYFIKKFGVDFQLAFYRRAAEALWKTKFPTHSIDKVTFELFVSLTEFGPPYETVVYKLSEETFKSANAKVSSLLQRYKFHVETGNWTISREEIENNGYVVF